ncbi:tetratricopeptide repeat protein [Paracrocinitomix mangrovi]|uniref:tetratricopeptide repeat protein n=1 Tax=Paracrocinitomix mangrovi TaxID=2862509 RepID=UPI001C8E48ED|nr:tetratricopeptide repeat protein [Paracrocinitomix mangrovi]UKN00757.1 tetratricopeptide repeat protein [Paracrocinitomix mangrovi]
MSRLILLFVIIISFSAFSQGEVEDKLRKADLVYNENPAESFSLCESAEREAKELNNTEFDGNIALCKARYYLLISMYDACSRELNKATLFFEKREDKVNLASVYNLKQNMLSKIGEIEEAHQFMLKVVEIDRETNNTDHLIGALNNLSLDYKRMNQADSMKQVLLQVEELEPYFEPTDYLYYNQNWGLYYILIKDYDKAVDFIDKALKVAEEEKMTDSKATNLATMSKVYRLKGNYEQALTFAEDAYAFSQEHNLIYETSEALVEWIAVLEKTGNYKEAFEVQKKWIRIDNQINDLERIQKVKAIEGQLELAQKEKKIVEGEVALKESKLNNQKAQTRNAWLSGVIVLIIVLLGYTAFIYLRTRKLNTTIQQQKTEVETKSLKLEEALNSINDSLEYSKLIQSSMLPANNEFVQTFNGHFILYQPRDIVSGDFYWIHKEGDTTILAVGDCTGHGVPGAMVSMVCHEALNKVVVEHKELEPGKILDGVRDIVTATFKRNSDNISDGMDICLITIKDAELKYAGANNALWIFRENAIDPETENIQFSAFRKCGLIEIKPDKQPIGFYHQTKPFTTISFNLMKNDRLYLFSDGYADQFGGDKGKKLKASNMKELFAKSQVLDIEEQGKHLKDVFKEWKGELEQLDDVCVVGIRI